MVSAVYFGPDPIVPLEASCIEKGLPDGEPKVGIDHFHLTGAFRSKLNGRKNRSRTSSSDRPGMSNSSLSSAREGW